MISGVQPQFNCRRFATSSAVILLLIQNYNFAVILYRCETRSLTLREECWLRVFENRELRRTFGPKKDNITVEWRKLYEEVNDLYSSPILFR